MLEADGWWVSHCVIPGGSNGGMGAKSSVDQNYLSAAPRTSPTLLHFRLDLRRKCIRQSSDLGMEQPSR